MTKTCVVCAAAMPQTTAAAPAYGCFKCVNDVLGMLADLELWIPTLDATSDDTGGSGYDTDFGPRRPHYGSRIPAGLDLDVIAAQSYDTVPTEDAPMRSVLGSLAGLADSIREQRFEPIPPAHRHTMTGELRYLRGAITWCATREDFDDVVRDVRELHRDVRMLARRERPRRVGKCPAMPAGRRCGAVLELWPADDVLKCPRCRSTWDHADLLALADTLAELDHATPPVRLVTRADIARHFGVSEVTVRRRCLPAGYGIGGVALYDLRRAAEQLRGVTARSTRAVVAGA